MKLELSAEEKMQLVDMVESDAWKVVKRIVEHRYRSCIEALLSMGENGDFRHAQGVAHGVGGIIASIEEAARPINPLESSTVSESSLNARKY